MSDITAALALSQDCRSCRGSLVELRRREQRHLVILLLGRPPTSNICRSYHKDLVPRVEHGDESNLAGAKRAPTLGWRWQFTISAIQVTGLWPDTAGGVVIVLMYAVLLRTYAHSIAFGYGSASRAFRKCRKSRGQAHLQGTRRCRRFDMGQKALANLQVVACSATGPRRTGKSRDQRSKILVDCARHTDRQCSACDWCLSVSASMPCSYFSKFSRSLP